MALALSRLAAKGITVPGSKLMDWLSFSGARMRACVCAHLRSSAYWYDPAIPPGPTSSAESAVSAAGGGMGGVAGGGSSRDGGGGGCGGWKTVGVGWACPARRMAPIEGQRLGVCSRESGQRDDAAQRTNNYGIRTENALSYFKI